jgi:REP element-mobilizing transposase RayT
LHWLYEARKRFGLCILNHVVTSNHIHLLVKDTDKGVTARSIQLAAGRTAQDYNRRKSQWVDAARRMGSMTRDDRWSESVAIGGEEFFEQVKTELGSAVGRRRIGAENKTYSLREPTAPYNPHFEGNNAAPSQNNAYFWDTILDSTDT